MSDSAVKKVSSLADVLAACKEVGGTVLGHELKEGGNYLLAIKGWPTSPDGVFEFERLMSGYKKMGISVSVILLPDEAELSLFKMEKDVQ